jgi:hypothetical protein
MKPKLSCLLVLLFALAALAAAPPRPVSPEAKTARVQHILFNTIIDTKGLTDKTTLAQALAAVEACLPPGQKVRLRIDEMAFGKQAARLAATPLRPDLPPLHSTLHVVLRKILARLPWKEKLDLAVRPTGIEITRPRLAAYRVVYDIRDVLKDLPWLRPWLSDLAEGFEDTGRATRPDLLVGLLFHAVSFEPWETVEVLNAARMEVFCSPERQQEVASLLDALRRLADNAVVMNARLYEVDRAFYTKNIAPLFARREGEGPRVVAIDEPLLKRILRKKLLQESEEDRLIPGREQLFLSRRGVFRFLDKPREGAARKRIATGLAGVSFSVRPMVSRDRRFLRLEITQRATTLVRIDKAKTLDAATGKEVEFESPNLSRISLTGTVQIPDGNPILLPVEYRPDKGGDKVWVLVARPFIWIEEEEKERRQAGGGSTGKSIWNAGVAKEEEKITPAGFGPILP